MHSLWLQSWSPLKSIKMRSWNHIRNYLSGKSTRRAPAVLAAIEAAGGVSVGTRIFHPVLFSWPRSSARINSIKHSRTHKKMVEAVYRLITTFRSIKMSRKPSKRTTLTVWTRKLPKINRNHVSVTLFWSAQRTSLMKNPEESRNSHPQTRNLPHELSR